MNILLVNQKTCRDYPLCLLGGGVGLLLIRSSKWCPCIKKIQVKDSPKIKSNIAERWRQHIKRGLGAETPTRNKLYPAMAQFGVENFTFEIVEKCPAAALNEKEDYWQDYFHAKDFGYSIK